MDSEFFLLLLVLGGAMCVLGFLYMVFGFFCMGPDFAGLMVILRGVSARFFGLAYMIVGLPAFAYGYAATRAPHWDYYRWLQPQIHQGNYLYWLGGWIAIVLLLHVISFFVKEMQDTVY